jgi:hypothetical protein
MTRNIQGLCLSVLLVSALILPAAGCITLSIAPSQQPSGNQANPSGLSSLQPPAPTSPTPPANQPGPTAPTPPKAPANQSGIGALQGNPPANQSGIGALQGNPPANQSGIGVLQGISPANQSGMGVLQGNPPANQSGIGVLQGNPPAPAIVANWSGKWLCGNWGTVTLIQSGDRVTGTYTYKDGKLTGNAGANKLFATWSEAPLYVVPVSAGEAEFTMSADGNSFTGRWRYGFSGDWGTWNGQRDLSNQLSPD